ncbi:MAG: hypothetical protein ABI954_06825 [Pyrinomonadaceae bacterium]
MGKQQLSVEAYRKLQLTVMNRAHCTNAPPFAHTWAASSAGIREKKLGIARVTARALTLTVMLSTRPQLRRSQRLKINRLLAPSKFNGNNQSFGGSQIINEILQVESSASVAKDWNSN